jgi:hypothetical protein
MSRTAETQAQAAKVAELKRLLATRSFDSLDTLEEAVDALMWDDDTANADDAPAPFSPSDRPQ